MLIEEPKHQQRILGFAVLLLHVLYKISISNIIKLNWTTSHSLAPLLESKVDSNEKIFLIMYRVSFSLYSFTSAAQRQSQAGRILHSSTTPLSPLLLLLLHSSPSPVPHLFSFSSVPPHPPLFHSFFTVLLLFSTFSSAFHLFLFFCSTPSLSLLYYPCFSSSSSNPAGQMNHIQQ